MNRQPLEPRRLRRPTGAYGWVDLRAVTHGHLQRAGTAPALAYLFLCTVSDRAGLSFWNLERMGEILGLDSQTLEAALARLNDLDLIARQGRVVQVLPLPPAPPESGTPPDSRPTPKVTRAVAPVEAISPVDEVDLTADEISRQVPEARRRVARLGGLACSERVQRVARALALEARSKQACPGGEARG